MLLGVGYSLPDPSRISNQSLSPTLGSRVKERSVVSHWNSIFAPSLASLPNQNDSSQAEVHPWYVECRQSSTWTSGLLHWRVLYTWEMQEGKSSVLRPMFSTFSRLYPLPGERVSIQLCWFTKHNHIIFSSSMLRAKEYEREYRLRERRDRIEQKKAQQES